MLAEDGNNCLWTQNVKVSTGYCNMYLWLNETRFPWDSLVTLQFARTQAKSSCGAVGCCVACAADAVQPHWLSLTLFHTEYLAPRFVKGRRLILSLLLKAFLRLRVTQWSGKKPKLSIMRLHSLWNRNWILFKCEILLLSREQSFLQQDFR